MDSVPSYSLKRERKEEERVREKRVKERERERERARMRAFTNAKLTPYPRVYSACIYIYP